MDSYVVWLIFGVCFSCFSAVFCQSCCGHTNNNCDNLLNQTSSVLKFPCGTRKNLYNGYCLSKCPIGLFPKDGKCIECHTQCSACTIDRCLSCKDSGYLTKNGSCETKCPSSSLMKNTSSPRTRLVDGRTKLEGVVEVYYDGAWGTICADGWDSNAAMVLCNELALGDVVESKIVGQARFKRSPGYKDMKIWLSGVNCSGKEKSIEECEHKVWAENECSHLEDVGVRCSGPDMSNTCETSCGDGYYSSQGRCLECPLDCKTCSAYDVCLSCTGKRYLEGNSCVAKCKPGTFGSSKSHKCEGCPEICLTCEEMADQHGRAQCTSCSMSTKYLSKDGQCVDKCSKGVALANYLRLSGNFSSGYEGLLEVKYGSKWHTICDEEFDLDNARVFCRELGYGQPISWQGGKYGRGKGKIILQAVYCDGHEESFIDCDHPIGWFETGFWDSYNCSHKDDIGLHCHPPESGVGIVQKCIDKCPAGMFQTKEGVCELCNRKCLTCAKGPEKCLICREGYLFNGITCVKTCPDDSYGNTTARQCFPCNQVCMTCDKRANNCLSCKSPLLHNGTYCSSTCSRHMYRKGHSCVSDCGPRYYPNENATIPFCDACPFACAVCSSSTHCKICEYGRVLTKQGKCEFSCPSGEIRVTHDPEPFGIDLPVRLANKWGSVHYGRLEVKHNNEWGAVCNTDWTYENAVVACRELMLGPPRKKMYKPDEDEMNDLPSIKTWLGNVDCTGTENSLADCKHLGWDDKHCDYTDEVYITCGPYPSSCELCPLTCLNCTSLNNCSVCIEGFSNINNKCVEKCPPGFYTTKGRQCKPCYSTCYTCDGPRINQCTSCVRPQLLLVDSRVCVDNCSSGYVELGTNGVIELGLKTGPYKGVPIVTVNDRKGLIFDDWLGIRGGHVVCRQLNMGTAVQVYGEDIYSNIFDESDMYLLPIMISNPECKGDESSIFDCPEVEGKSDEYDDAGEIVMLVQCSGPDSSGRCLKSCPTDYYLRDDNACFPCSKKCLQCERSPNNCTACPKDQFLTWNRKCVDYCHQGTFYHKASNTCRKCNHSKCKACHGSEDVCTICANGKYLSNGDCLSKCDPGEYKKTGVNNLRLVEVNQFNRGVVEILVDGVWRAVCGTNWGNLRIAAMVCSQLGYGDPLHTGILMYRPTRTYEVKPFSQLYCNGEEKELSDCNRVNSCPGYSLAELSCSSRLTPNKVCVSECGLGFYLNLNKTACEPCSSQCKTCTGSASNCTSCDIETKVSVGSLCFDKCPDGLFAHLENNTCRPCSIKCKTCIDGWSDDRCSSCKKPHFLRGTSCVNDCYPDYSLLELMKGIKPTGKIRKKLHSSGLGIVVEVFMENEWGVLCHADYFATRLICQEFGYEGGKVVDKEKVNDWVPKRRWSPYCKYYEQFVTDCQMVETRARHWCDSTPVIACSTKPLDKRICRKENNNSCSSDTCADSVTCVGGDGKMIPKGHSYCTHCQEGYIGDGKNCTAISKILPALGLRSYRLNFAPTVKVGDRFDLQCSGYAGRKYLFGTRDSWSKDGQYIIHTYEYPSEYRIENIHYRDAGIYRCILRNTAGSLTIMYNITVVGPPLITRADNIDIVHGEPAILTCEVLTNPSAKIMWVFNNATIGTNTTRHDGPRMLANYSLFIPHTIAQDAGNYTCIAKNLHGSAKEWVRLRVAEEPRFERKATYQSVELGEMAKFSCQPLSTGHKMKIKWRRNGKTLENGDKYKVDYGRLTIKNVSPEDCGEYHCVARDRLSIITSVGTLAIKDEAPCIHTPPRYLSLESGMYARFYCAASGDPVAKIYWQNNENLTSNVFEIQNVNISHVGVYTCTAKSGDGVVTKVRTKTAYALLSVDDHHPCPLIFQKPEDTSAIIGMKAMFYCDGVGVPPTVISWYRSGRLITNQENYTVQKYSVFYKNRALVIYNVDEDDVGDYKCVVSSKYGTMNATASLTLVSTTKHSLTVGVTTGDSSSSNTAVIVIAVVICVLVILVIIYFVQRYRRYGVTPIDVIKNASCKRFSRSQSSTHLAVFKHDGSESLGNDEMTSDSNPFLRD